MCPRKRIDDELLKSEYLKIRLNKSEHETFAQKAKSVGMSLSKFGREMLTKKSVIITSKVDLETKIQLKKIGVNINQIAKRINSLSDSKSVLYECSKLDFFIEEIRKTISKIE